MCRLIYLNLRESAGLNLSAKIRSTMFFVIPGIASGPSRLLITTLFTFFTIFTSLFIVLVTGGWRGRLLGWPGSGGRTGGTSFLFTDDPVFRGNGGAPVASFSMSFILSFILCMFVLIWRIFSFAFDWFSPLPGTFTYCEILLYHATELSYTF